MGWGWSIVCRLVPALAVLCAACGGSPVRGTVLEMETMLVTAEGAPIEDEELLFYSESEIFDEGNNLLRDGEYAESLRRYRALIQYFPDGQYTRGAIFNSGLAHQGLDDWAAAADLYRQVTERWPASDDATDAFFQWAECRAQLGDWEGVIPLMERVLRRTRLTLVDRAEAHLRWAHAAVEMRDYARAEQHYREVLRLNRQVQIEGNADGDPDNQPLPDFHPIIVEANFGLGRAYHELFLEIKLVLPGEAIRRALLDKAQLLEQARLAYLDAVRAGHRYWSVAAAFMIGQLYEDFFLDVLACEVPHSFDELTVEVYFEELRSFLAPVVERALSIYEDTLAMAERMRADSVWVEETEHGIRRVQDYLLDPETQREQERLILEQRHPHGAQDPNRRWIPPSPPDT